MQSLLSKIIAIIASSLSVVFAFVLYVGLTGQQSDPHFGPVVLFGLIAALFYSTVVFLPLNALLFRMGKTRCWHYVIPVLVLNISIVIVLGLNQRSGPPFEFALNSAIWGTSGALAAAVFWVLAIWDRSR
jgi:hypothetical protein